jgi:hypothetical protein
VPYIAGSAYTHLAMRIYRVQPGAFSLQKTRGGRNALFHISNALVRLTALVEEETSERKAAVSHAVCGACFSHKAVNERGILWYSTYDLCTVH